MCLHMFTVIGMTKSIVLINDMHGYLICTCDAIEGFSLVLMGLCTIVSIFKYPTLLI